MSLDTIDTVLQKMYDSEDIHSELIKHPLIKKWSFAIEQDLADNVCREVLQAKDELRHNWQEEFGDYNKDHLRWKLPLEFITQKDYPAIYEFYETYSEAKPQFQFVSIVGPGGYVWKHEDTKHMKRAPQGHALRKSRFSVQWPVDCDFMSQGVGKLDTRPGRIYLFDHCIPHWVENRSTDTDKVDISLILDPRNCKDRLQKHLKKSIEDWFESYTVTLDL